MREFRFRAWGTRGLVMRPVTGVQFSGTGIKQVFVIGVVPAFGNPYSKSTNCLRGDRLELMQYTGLKDKNGVQIFEGDITNMGLVEWDNGRFWVGSTQNIDEVLVSLEVIGNVYENPELAGEHYAS